MKQVRIDSLKVDDTILWGNQHWLVIKTHTLGNGLVHISLYSTTNGRNWATTFHDYTQVYLKVERIDHAKPCRDSDCDCIYDEVG